MSAFSRVGIMGRLALGFGFVLVLMLALTLLSIMQVNRISGNLHVVNDVNSVKQRYAINFRGSVHDRSIGIRDVVLASSTPELNATVALIEKLAASYAENEVKLNDMLAASADVTAEERAIASDIAAIQAKTNPVVAQIITLAKRGRSIEAETVMMEQARPLFVEWLAAINRFIDYQELHNKEIGADVSQSANNFKYLQLAGQAVALALAAAGAWLVSRSITLPVARLQSMLVRMAGGEFASDAELVSRRDEVGSLAKAVEQVRVSIIANADRQAREARIAQEHAQEEMERARREGQEKIVAEVVDKLGAGLERLNSPEFRRHPRVRFSAASRTRRATAFRF